MNPELYDRLNAVLWKNIETDPHAEHTRPMKRELLSDLESFIQTAIDEAVEADRKKMNVEAWDAVRALATKKPHTTLQDCIGKIVPGPNENRII